MQYILKNEGRVYELCKILNVSIDTWKNGLWGSYCVLKKKDDERSEEGEPCIELKKSE